jgi:hypothetical protein
VCTTRLATIVVDVDDPGLGWDKLSDLMGVVGGRQPGADVEELRDAIIHGEPAHRLAEEGAHREGGQRKVREAPAGCWSAAARSAA